MKSTGQMCYFVYGVGDEVIENANEGADIVKSSISWTLDSNIEKLLLTNSSNINGTGNELDNVITGGSGANILDGRDGNDWIDGDAGADTLIGGLGNDYYFVGDIADVTIENVGEGTDRVLSTVSWTLGANIEELQLNGNAAIDGTGNELNNILFGNSGENILSGGAGDDLLIDFYGNNVLQGGTGNDQLIGGFGNDTLVGGAGNDNLSGGAGDDAYMFNVGDGIDTISEESGTDRITFGAGIQANNVTVSRSGSKITLAASPTDSISFFLGETGYSVESMVFNDGAVWQAADLDQKFNSAPTGEVFINGVTKRNQTLTATHTLADADGLGTIGYQWQASTDGSAWNPIIGATASSFTLTQAQVGQHIRVISSYTDGNGIFESVASTATTGVADINNAPTHSDAISNQIATEDSSFSFILAANTFADADSGDSLTLSATLADGSPLPTWLNFDAATRTFSGTPVNANVGTMNVIVTATDTSGSSTSQSFNVAVANTNDAPIVEISLTSQVTTEDTPFSFTLAANTFMDIDAGDSLTLSATLPDGSPLPAWLSFDAATRAFSGSPANSDIGTLSVIVTATDLGGLSSTTELQLAIVAHDAVSLTGSAGNDTLSGFSGDDTLDGSAGADTLIGRRGNDTYVVDDADDAVIESANEGMDSIQSSISWALNPNVENLILTGVAAINGTGNELDNTITGNSGANTLDGGAGADVMNGGGGEDTYYVDNLGDTIAEYNDGSWDVVYSTVSFTLASHVNELNLLGSENLDGTGNSSDNDLYGNDGNNILIGLGGVDWLDGGAGVDTLIGGTSSDLYFINDIYDTIIENANEGSTDTVKASISWTLGANIERLTLTGSNTINGMGNTLNNVLKGNSGANILDGGAGADSMSGGLGDDTFIADSASDVVTEYADEGTDLVQSSITWTLGANIENLTLTGTAAINATGNTLNNILTGNSGANILDGGVGADILNGGGGADTYYVDNTGDVITDFGDGSWDIVNSSISYTISEVNLNELRLSGSSDINGTGNNAANIMLGNSGMNLLNGVSGNDNINGSAGLDFLEGMAGNDTLNDTSGSSYLNGGSGTDTLTGGASADLFIGGTGNDTITTGAGNDVIAFNKGDGYDTITVGAGSKTLSLGGGVAYSDLVLRKSGSSLLLDTGSGEGMTFSNWYTGTTNQNVLNLQIVAEAMTSFNANSSDPLLNKKVQDFDFKGLVGAFDAALAATPGLTSWALTNGLTQFKLSASDTDALGGDLAYQYGKNATLAGIGLTAAQQVMGNANFGTQTQTLQPLAGLQVGLDRLS